MFSTIFLDVDNTLLDFNACALCSMRDAFAHFQLHFDEERVFSTFLSINNALWTQIEEGTLTKAQHYQIRWKTILKALNIRFDGLTMERKFVEGLHEYAVPVEGAVDLVQYLSSKYCVCVTSNAPYDQQIHRLKKAGLLEYMDRIYISEKIGVQKPAKEFFDYCMDDLNPITPQEIIVIGDSLQADIQGGVNAGLSTVWFNPEHKPDSLHLQPTYTVDCLKKIKNFL